MLLANLSETIYFSLSYLQLENRVLPPIGTTSRATKLNALTNVQEPIADIKAFNDEMTSNTATAQHIGSSTMANSATDLRMKNGHELYANACIGEKGDNSANTAINLNIGTKNNRTNGQLKLPTILPAESKTGTTSNCK